MLALPLIFCKWNPSISRGRLGQDVKVATESEMHYFLIVFHSNYGSILVSFWDTNTGRTMNNRRMTSNNAYLTFQAANNDSVSRQTIQLKLELKKSAWRRLENHSLFSGFGTCYQRLEFRNTTNYDCKQIQSVALGLQLLITPVVCSVYNSCGLMPKFNKRLN